MEAPRSWQQYREAVKPFIDMFTEQVMEHAENTYGPLSERDKRMAGQIIWTVVNTYIQYHQKFGKILSKNPEIMEMWAKIDLWRPEEEKNET